MGAGKRYTTSYKKKIKKEYEREEPITLLVSFLALQ